MRRPQFFLVILLFCLLSSAIFAQTVQLQGFVRNEKGKPLQLVNIRVGTKQGTVTDSLGFYQLLVPVNKKLIFSISFVGYKSKDTLVEFHAGKRLILNFQLISTATNLPGLEVREQNLQLENAVRLYPKDVLVSPSVSSGVEDLIKTLPGVTSNNELSSQYSVRGGNYDENLVYVNGIEIYRPFLVNSGRQEGLSFVNPALVSGITFYAGGFGVQYGDKMSSVLDITYKHPKHFGAGISLSFLGAGLSVEGTGKNHKFTYLVGSRYKTNRYLLRTLDTKGNYEPNFADFQSLLTYKLTKNWDVSLLTYFSRNRYKVIPSSRQTDFGMAQHTLRFTVYFNGAEIDRSNVAQGGLTFTYHPNSNTNLDFIVSGFSTHESETYDVQGQYWIGQVDMKPGSQNQGKVIQTLGIGTYLQHARDYFDARVFSVKHRGSYFYRNHHLLWGARYQHQFVNDEMREWEVNDSAGYFLPNPISSPGNPYPARPKLNMHYFVSAHNILSINRFSAYFSDRWNILLKNKSQLWFTAGTRFYYWDFTHEFLFSPRLNLAYKPFSNSNLTLRFASGVYYQPPFYREMLDMDGQINHNIKSPRSIHFILSGDYNFPMWNRPFVFSTAVYYKKMDHVIPYEVENIRIRYYARQVAKAYAAGIDFKLYGAFVKGIDSWISLSLLKTAEDIQGDFYYKYFDKNGVLLPEGNHTLAADSIKVCPGYIPRPTDRRLNFTIFFQDYIPGHKAFKVHLRLLFGTGLPFGPPQSQRYQQTLRMPPYRRVDIGFSWNLLGKKTDRVSLGKLKSMWVSLEVFNLFQVYNTISYNWITDVYNQQFAIPNYLTTRRVNLKIMLNF